MSIIRHFLDRQWLEKVYLPALNGKILFVGIAPYTEHYYKLIPSNSIWHTLDINKNITDLHSKNHYTGDFLMVDINENYNHIALYGLWGTKNSYTNNLQDIQKSIEKAKILLKPQGTLLIGIGCSYNIISLKECEKLCDINYIEIYKNKLRKIFIYWGRKPE